MPKFSFILLLGLLSNCTYALFEFSGQYGVDRQVYGTTRQNKITSTTYSGSVAMYLFNYTAIELNYSKTRTITDEVFPQTTTAEFESASQVGTVDIESYGFGLRQAFAPRKARFIPTLSLGYAKRFAKDYTSGVIRRNSDGATFSYVTATSKLRFDSVFATLGLNIKITRMLSLRASAQTIFKAFEFNRAQDNMKYLIGFSWYL